MLSELVAVFTEDQYQMLKTRCSGSAGNWRDANGDVMIPNLSVRHQPRASLIRGCISAKMEGLLKFVKFGFADNPYFLQEWSLVKGGKNYS